MLYPAELRGRVGARNRGSRATNQLTRTQLSRNQLTWLGAVTGSGKGATGTPSSTSDFACSSVAWP